MQQLIGNFRTMFLFRGFAAVLFGILTLVWPGISLTVLVLLFGVFAVISGITAVAGGPRHTGETGGGLLPFSGMLCVPARVGCLVWCGSPPPPLSFPLALPALLP